MTHRSIDVFVVTLSWAAGTDTLALVVVSLSLSVASHTLLILHTLISFPFPSSPSPPPSSSHSLFSLPFLSSSLSINPLLVPPSVHSVSSPRLTPRPPLRAHIQDIQSTSSSPFPLSRPSRIPERARFTLAFSIFINIFYFYFLFNPILHIAAIAVSLSLSLAPTPVRRNERATSNRNSNKRPA